MTGSPPVSRPPSARIVTGAARVTQTAGTEGRTLFPSPAFSHWPPFEMLAETTEEGTGAADPHPHAREEVVNYVLSGSLEVRGENRRTVEVPEGAANLLATVRHQDHDVGPAPGARAHWVSLVLHLPPGVAEPRVPLQTAPSQSAPNAPPGLRVRRITGDDGPLHSVLGLEMRDAQFQEYLEIDLPIEPGRTALVYVLAGRVKVANRELTAGSGLLSEGLAGLPTSGEQGSRFIFASVGRSL